MLLVDWSVSSGTHLRSGYSVSLTTRFFVLSTQNSRLFKGKPQVGALLFSQNLDFRRQQHDACCMCCWQREAVAYIFTRRAKTVSVLIPPLLSGFTPHPLHQVCLQRVTENVRPPADGSSNESNAVLFWASRRGDIGLLLTHVEACVRHMYGDCQIPSES